jgi:hypothetical protein
MVLVLAPVTTVVPVVQLLVCSANTLLPLLRSAHRVRSVEPAPAPAQSCLRSAPYRVRSTAASRPSLPASLSLPRSFFFLTFQLSLKADQLKRWTIP